MSEPYHKYVFDNGQVVGKYEEMYAAEDVEGFDAWHQCDMRDLRLRLTTEILRDYNFDRVLDIGCGKGMGTQFLKRKNNYVLGVDASPTAIKKARIAFPDIAFGDENSPVAGRVDLISFQGTLAYLPRWRTFLQGYSRRAMARYCIVSEYIPPNPTGYVKSVDELVTEFKRWYDVKTDIILNGEVAILFGKSK